MYLESDWLGEGGLELQVSIIDRLALKTIRNYIAALVVMGSLVVNFVDPRSALYTAFREINKHTVSFQTRGWESIEGTNLKFATNPRMLK